MCAVFLLCSVCIGVVAAAKRELNNRVCMCLAASGWSTLLAALSSFAAPPPAPHTPPTAARGREKRRREYGERKGEGGRMNESLNELYCERGHACA